MGVSSDFITVTLLKSDVFSETQSGHLAADPSTRLTRRRLDRLPLWSRGIGRLLAAREARALRRLEGIAGLPQLIRQDRDNLIRSWIEGTPLQLSGGLDRAWTRDAHRLLRQMHRRGVTHNDLAKPQNWLITPEGRAAVIDLQLASVHRRRGLIFRLARYEDLRHLLKQKQRFAPELLTPTARHLLARRSLPSRLSRGTLKPLYNFVTRRLLNWSDGEGLGADMGARIAAGEARLNALPGVRRSCLCPYQKAGGMGLYAFIESDRAPSESRAEADHIQPVPALPRGPKGRLRRDLLALVAENRVAEVDPLLAEDTATARIMAPIIAERLNLTDRYIR